MAHKVEELQVYQRALAAAQAISVITDRQSFVREWELRNQLRDASGKVPAHISEGFGQKTDRHFAHSLYIARGTTQEIRTHMKVATDRGVVSEDDRKQTEQSYDEIARMLTGLIRHLEREIARIEDSAAN